MSTNNRAEKDYGDIGDYTDIYLAIPSIPWAGTKLSEWVYKKVGEWGVT